MTSIAVGTVTCLFCGWIQAIVKNVSFKISMHDYKSEFYYKQFPDNSYLLSIHKLPTLQYSQSVIVLSC